MVQSFRFTESIGSNIFLGVAMGGPLDPFSESKVFISPLSWSCDTSPIGGRSAEWLDWCWTV
jgi:hypothetical protein